MVRIMSILETIRICFLAYKKLTGYYPVSFM